VPAKKRKTSSHQKKLIRRFYENRDAIETQRLQELVTEIYLAGPGKKAERLWARADEILERAPDIEPAEARRVVSERDVEALARLAGDRFGAE
jgi:hypothetical protein